MRFQFTINNLQDFRLPKIIVRAKRDKNLQITKGPRGKLALHSSSVGCGASSFDLSGLPPLSP